QSFFKFQILNLSQNKTTMNINRLPDLCLLTIFENHNLKQQLKNATVCTRWRDLQHRLFLVQKSLTLALGPKRTTNLIRESPFNTLHHDCLLNEDGSRAFPHPLFNLTK